jgi:hypothetical protein
MLIKQQEKNEAEEQLTKIQEVVRTQQAEVEELQTKNA